MTETKLTPIQRKMLTGAFYIDGWHNRHFLEEANDLVEQGLLSRQESGDEQYTCYNYEPIKPA
jgi:hypothetical protein